jgi:PleD family two-component response regulator
VPPGSAASPGIPRFTALVVEAPSIGRQFLTRLLNHQGFSADVADNGYQAERALAGRAYDFVFVDLQLAQAGGTEWLTRRPEFAERTVFLNDSSASSAFRGLSPTALVVDNPPSEQEIEGILKSYSHRIHGRSR